MDRDTRQVGSLPPSAQVGLINTMPVSTVGHCELEVREPVSLLGLIPWGRRFYSLSLKDMTGMPLSKAPNP